MVDGWQQWRGMTEPKEDDTERGLPLLGRLWNIVAGFFEAQSQKVWTEFSTIVHGIVDTYFGAIIQYWSEFIDQSWERTIGEWLEWGWIDKETKDDFIKLRKIAFPLNIFVFFTMFMSVYAGHIKQIVYVAGADIRRRYLSKYETEDARPEQILPAAFIAPEKVPLIRQTLMNQGLSESQINLMFISMYRLYDEGTIQNLYFRGILDEAGLYERMRELGYTDARIKEMIQGWPIIPNVADLLHLVAKEAFEPDIIEHYGYADEFPEEQMKWLKAQGISEDWAKKFWYAHWDTPSIMHGFEMMHRYDPDNPKEKIISQQELFDLFRTIEIPPFWRDRLTKIAYQPLTRVDVRRMHDMGVLDDEELIRAYEELGYHKDNALKMAQFTIRYNKQSDKDLTRGEILKGFAEDLIIKEDAKKLLLDMEYSDDEVEYLLTYEEYKKAKSYQDMIVKNIQSRFEGNLINQYQARVRLSKLNLTGQYIEILLDKWLISKMDEIKLPSKTDLAKFLSGGIINKDEYIVEMTNLGYKRIDIERFLKLTPVKRERTAV